MRKILILLAILLAVTSASARTIEQNAVIDQRGYMPSGLFMFISAVALISLVISYRWNDEMCGFISVAMSFVMLWTSRAVDYVTGITVNSSSSDVVIVHTIYHPEILTVIAIFCFLLSLANLYRIYLISQQETTQPAYRGA